MAMKKKEFNNRLGHARCESAINPPTMLTSPIAIKMKQIFRVFEEKV
jgi:hypothetical protein